MLFVFFSSSLNVKRRWILCVWNAQPCFSRLYCRGVLRLPVGFWVPLRGRRIHQAVYMLHKLLVTMQNRFVTEGGIKERMYQSRVKYRES